MIGAWHRLQLQPWCGRPGEQTCQLFVDAFGKGKRVYGFFDPFKLLDLGGVSLRVCNSLAIRVTGRDFLSPRRAGGRGRPA
jgi:hypothetical protein